MSFFKFFTFLLLISLVCGQVAVNKAKQDEELDATNEGTGESSSTAAPTETSSTSGDGGDTPAPTGDGGDTPAPSGGGDGENTSTDPATDKPVDPDDFTFTVTKVVAELNGNFFNVTELEVEYSGPFPTGFVSSVDGKPGVLILKDGQEYTINEPYSVKVGDEFFGVGIRNNEKSREKPVYVGCKNNTIPGSLLEINTPEGQSTVPETVCPGKLVGKYSYTCDYVVVGDKKQYSEDPVSSTDFLEECNCAEKFKISKEGEIVDEGHEVTIPEPRDIGATTTTRIGNCNNDFKLTCGVEGWKPTSTASCTWEDSASMLSISSLLIGLVILVVII